jgi:hypothetical protein
MKVKMIATGLSRYGTRRLMAGDEFEATAKDAKLLKAIRKADYSKATAKAPPAIEQPPAPVAEIDALRAEFEARSGEAPDKRWGVPRLREEIDGLASEE